MSSGEILRGGAGEGHRQPNHFAGGAIDRAAERRRDQAWITDRAADPTSVVVPVWRSRSLVVPEREGGYGYDAVLLSIREAAEVAGPPSEWIFLGIESHRAVFAAEVTDAPVPRTPGEPVESPPLPGELHDLHRIGATLGQHEGSLLAYARAVVTWSRAHRFCGRCGHPTRSEEGGHVRRCDNAVCAAQHFPRTDPAIIVLVEDHDRCLLGRKDTWPAGVYSALAGFVEPGESLSEAVAREVREETGIHVDHVRYRSSQPWPFPASIMLGFHARRTGGELAIDLHELSDARWFDRDEVASRHENDAGLPSRVSIARRLIAEWLSGDGR
jgi:NAD+ diphosphatase